jgi:hypothetical protein
MKKSLLLSLLFVTIFLLSAVKILKGQTVLLSENFTGFTTGSHSAPSTNDISGSLDSKTESAGWTGMKVYSAGGEIKISTSEINGWIETPLVDFSGHTSAFILKFDIAKWPGDAATVKILLNGDQIGNIIEPSEEFKTVNVSITSGITSGRIKFESQAKRFFLDNIEIHTDEPTAEHFPIYNPGNITVFPNPANENVTIKLSKQFTDIYNLKILSLSGKVMMNKAVTIGAVTLDLEKFDSGYYIIVVSGNNNASAVPLVVSH